MSTALLSSLSVSVTSLHINIPPDPSALRSACSGVFDGSYTPEQVAAFDLVTLVFLLPHYIAHSPLAFTLQSLAFAGTFTYSFCLDMGPIDWEISTIRLPTTDEYQNICRSGMYSEPQQQHIQMLFEPILRYCRSLTSLDADHLVFHHGSLSGADIPEYDIYPALATLTHLKASNIDGSQLFILQSCNILIFPNIMQQISVMHMVTACMIHLHD